MEQYIKLTSMEVDSRSEGLVLLEASNGTTSGELDFYISPDEIGQLSAALIEFPNQVDDAVVFESGLDLPGQDSSYILLCFVTTNSRGSCAIHVRMNNCSAPPLTEVSEFYIYAEPSQINRLGALLHKYSTKQYRVMEWTPRDGKLIE